MPLRFYRLAMTMNATDRGRRSDALYYDNISRRELCDRIANLESDMDSHRARAQHWRKLAQEMASREIERLEAAKKVRDMLASKRRQEFVGHSVIDHVTSEGPAFCQWLDTDEPIVRCRDCKSFTEGKLPDECPHFCTLHGSDYVAPNGFCAWGEVEENEVHRV